MALSSELVLVLLNELKLVSMSEPELRIDLLSLVAIELGTRMPVEGAVTPRSLPDWLAAGVPDAVESLVPVSATGESVSLRAQPAKQMSDAIINASLFIILFLV